MKHPFTIYDLRFTIWKKSPASVVGNHQSSIINHKSRQGVALIITLILLGVVTFMAITFLALSRRERSAVTTVTDTAGARLAADTALANAEAQVIANVLATTNPFNFGLLVSTNGWPTIFTNLPDNLTNLYLNPRAPVLISTNEPLGRFYLDLNRNGRFETNGWVTNLDNNGVGLGTTNFEVGDPEWIGILERPDAPYGPNNKFIARYAFIAVPVGNTLDLNAIHNQAQWFRPPSGSLPAGQITVNPSPPTSGYNDNYVRNEGVGSWEINLAAFLADLNTNKWGQDIGQTTGFYNYLYQGLYQNWGLAFDDARALLTYRYANNFKSLASVKSLFPGGIPVGYTIFGSDGIDGYTYGLPLMTGFQLPSDEDSALNGIQPNGSPWVGADNTNHFFTHQELFDPAKTEINATLPGFVERLQQAGTNVSTYDRYTFYRLLAQLGTDTTPDSGKMNLNYDNLNPYLLTIGGVTVPSPNGVAVSTNFVGWQPLAFFTNAADRLLRAYTTQWRNSNPTNFAATFYAATGFTNIVASQWTTNYLPFGVTNIPVLISNQFVYSSAVNRLLQLAANMYDATTNNNPGVKGNNYPSVFRPTFWVTNESGYTNVYINGYQQIVSGPLGTNDLQLSLPLDVTSLLLGASTTNYLNGVNVYGVPWIIGAKKGFPNFNKFGMQNIVQIERELQIARKTIPTTSVTNLIFTNQLYIFNISNSIGIECWNSYSNAYVNLNPKGVQIVVQDTLSMQITNDAGGFASGFSGLQLFTNITVTSWPGSAWNTAAFNSQPPAANSFIVPINTASLLLTNSNFYFGTSPPGVPAGFWPGSLNLGWETNKHDFQFPQFGLLTTNRLQVFMLDGTNVIDYVQFAGPQSSRNLNAVIQTNAAASGPDNMWSTALDPAGVPYGILSQIYESDHGTAGDAVWGGDTATVRKEIDGFATFMGLTAPYTEYTNDPTVLAMQTNYVMQVPFPAIATAYDYTSWQANDPLVHYLASDLTFIGTEANNGPKTGANHWTSPTAALPRPSFNVVNDRYQPWGAKMLQTSGVDVNSCNLTFKDPLVRGSDYWDFPTNKFPTVGWLGRVHRGTPWQSVYLKASSVLDDFVKTGTTSTNYIGTNTWVQWTGNAQLTYGQYFDAANTAPVQDRLLFDLFTTAFNDNATRGTLSVNQDHLAAWSALFSGVVAITNNAPDLPLRSVPQYQNLAVSYTNTIIQPAGPYTPALPLAQQPPVVQLVNGINQTRANTSLFPLQSFAHVGDILATPQLTEQSPFLHLYNGTLSDGAQITNGISDEMYEWLPQQTMSLLRCAGSPRYVIYCYGQALKPAPNAIYTGSGPYFGMITNYQIVSEIATRAVVRFGSSLTNVIAGTNNLVGGTNWFSVPVATNNSAVIENFNILPAD